MRSLYFLVPIEPRDREAWRDSSHVGVAAIHAVSEGEAREIAAKAFSQDRRSPWLDKSLSACFVADPVTTGRDGETYVAPQVRMKLPKRTIPEDASLTDPDTDMTGPGAFTWQPRLSGEARMDYIAASLDPDTGIRSDVEPRVFLEAAADATIISYPKSGKTWLAYLVSRYIAGHLGFSELHDGTTGEGGLWTLAPEARRAYLAEVAKRRTDARWAPLIRFMHLDSLGYPYFAPKTLGAPGTDRHILLVRDPRDILVSHYHHIVVKNKGVFDAHRLKPRLATDIEIGEFIRSDYLGIRHLLGYFSGWGRWAEESGAPVFFYEDFVSRPHQTLGRLLTTLGVSELNDELVDKAVEAGSFSRLQSVERAAQSGRGKPDVPSARRIRRGKVGGFADEVSEEDADFMTRVMARADIPVLRRYLEQTG